MSPESEALRDPQAEARAAEEAAAVARGETVDATEPVAEKPKPAVQRGAKADDVRKGLRNQRK